VRGGGAERVAVATIGRRVSAVAAAARDHDGARGHKWALIPDVA